MNHCSVFLYGLLDLDHTLPATALADEFNRLRIDEYARYDEKRKPRIPVDDFVELAWAILDEAKAPCFDSTFYLKIAEQLGFPAIAVDLESPELPLTFAFLKQPSNCFVIALEGFRCLPAEAKKLVLVRHKQGEKYVYGRCRSFFLRGRDGGVAAAPFCVKQALPEPQDPPESVAIEHPNAEVATTSCDTQPASKPLYSWLSNPHLLTDFQPLCAVYETVGEEDFTTTEQAIAAEFVDEASLTDQQAWQKVGELDEDSDDSELFPERLSSAPAARLTPRDGDTIGSQVQADVGQMVKGKATDIDASRQPDTNVKGMAANVEAPSTEPAVDVEPVRFLEPLDGDGAVAPPAEPAVDVEPVRPLERLDSDGAESWVQVAMPESDVPVVSRRTLPKRPHETTEALPPSIPQLPSLLRNEQVTTVVEASQPSDPQVWQPSSPSASTKLAMPVVTAVPASETAVHQREHVRNWTEEEVSRLYFKTCSQLDTNPLNAKVREWWKELAALRGFPYSKEVLTGAELAEMKPEDVVTKVKALSQVSRALLLAQSMQLSRLRTLTLACLQLSARASRQLTNYIESSIEAWAPVEQLKTKRSEWIDWSVAQVCGSMLVMFKMVVKLASCCRCASGCVQARTLS